MSETNITTVSFNGEYATVSEPLWQYDYGQVLQIEDLDLPSAYETHISNYEYDGESTTVIGTADGIAIPDEYLQTGLYVYVFIYLHSSEDDGETVYKITCPVNRRAEAPEGAVPSQEQADAIAQAIAALNAAVAQTAQDVTTTEENATRAETAADNASTYATRAEEAASSVQGYSEDASEYATTAKSYAVGGTNTRENEDIDNAKYYKEQAENSASVSSSKAEDARQYAELAQQGAANAGYMAFHIDERGHLMMDRTDNTNVNFYLDDRGHLIMEAL